MEWFKHYNSESQDNVGLRQLWDSGDFAAYGFYWQLLEMLSRFDKERTGRMTISYAILRRETGWNRQRLEKVLTKIVSTFEIELTPKLNETFELSYLKWLKTQESRGGKREAKNTQKPTEIRDKTKDNKKEKKQKNPAELHPLILIWNATVTNLSKVKDSNSTRDRKIAAIYDNMNPLEWTDTVKKINASDFCIGKNDRGWKATFDWLLQPETYLKVNEGKYDNRKTTTARQTSFGNQRPDEDLSDHSAFSGGKQPELKPVGADNRGTDETK